MTTVKQNTQFEDVYLDLTFGKDKIRVSAFPPGMHDLIMNNIIDEFPLPNPPKKAIESFAGTPDNPEMIDDFDDPDYIEAKKEANKQRENAMAERLLNYTLNECCKVLTIEEMKKDIARLTRAKIVRFPKDLQEAEIAYVKSVILKSKDQFATVIQTAIALSIVDDAEVADAIKSFQS
jgi:hypothetical protein